MDTNQDYIEAARDSLLNPTDEGFIKWVSELLLISVDDIKKFKEIMPTQFEGLCQNYWDDYLADLEYSYSTNKEDLKSGRE